MHTVPRIKSTSSSNPRRPSMKASRPHRDGSSRDSVVAFSSTSAAIQCSAGPSETPTKYTKTGRISKAKKGLKVHLCEPCRKSYTRAEHLRRHRQNHNGTSLQCDWPGCGKTFHRADLLERHKAQHNGPSLNDDGTHRSSVTSQVSFASMPSLGVATALQSSSREVVGSAQDVAQQDVPTSTPGLMDSTTPSPIASSNKIAYHAAQFPRSTTAIGVEDVTAHAGSLFHDYRWGSLPEYLATSSDYAFPYHISQCPDILYVLSPYSARRPRTLSNASLIGTWTQHISRSSPYAISPRPLYWFDVDPTDLQLQSMSLSNSSSIASCTTSDTSVYNAPAKHYQMHQPSYLSSSTTTASYRSFEGSGQ